MSLNTIIIFLIGVIVGILGLIITRRIKHPDGILQIDTSDPEKDSYFFEILLPLSKLNHKRLITVKINNRNINRDYNRS